MKQSLTPNKSLNKAYRRQKISRGAIESFKTNLNHLLNELDEKETEEHLKNDVTQFFNDTWYKGEFLINTKGRTDLVIHNDKTAKSSVGVLLEVKKPSNKSEMVSEANLNKKALQELLLYYLRERVEGENNDIKYLVVTNVYEWFIFDASVFYKYFYEDKALIKSFKAWDSGQKDSSKTELFYKEIAGPAIDRVKENLEYTHFDLRNYTKYLEKEDDSSKLINLFKLLSPTHLLKQPFANDSNSLNKQFYGELLHIIGLEEIKDGGKKIIQRKAEGNRNEGSLLENAVAIMEDHDRLRNLDKPSQFGETYSEQLYNVALELSITWINRILFLKLLESQLVAYHKGDKSYKFLSAAVIPNYDALDQLFFGVLAKKHEERRDQVKEKFAKIPYLNSSLFEPTELEAMLMITQLDNNINLSLYSQTVLKNDKGKKQTGNKPTLNYLFEFLEAYDFSSEGTEEIQEDSKSLINASVLGLIFEKINGYKDGSFYTPGFITMYMCKETIRRAVVQKFNETKGWELKDFAQLYDKIEDKAEANKIINSLHICDPAVGSGHFLVSALNEIIAIKSELKILMDKEGKTLRDYDISIANDELVIEDDNGNFFQYATGSKEKQRIQETLFQEKQTIIENCLFGVDINPNSVKICRLRLWIELLKNAYYKNETELETLPNIDINIKCGNSLISRFDLDVDIKEALKRSKWTIDSYKIAVDTYRNAQSKEEKREMERLINDIKSNFRSEISKKDKKVINLYKLNGEMANLTTQTSMFEMSAKEKKIWSKKVETLSKSIQKLDTQIEEIKSNKIYDNAFEWRFEFPEVLNDEGEFVGFDAVIGNPPYIYRNMNMELYKPYFKKNYASVQGNYDLYKFFMELCTVLSKTNGNISFIVPNTFLSAQTYLNLRTLLIEKVRIMELYDLGLDIFDGVTVENIVFSFVNSSESSNDTLIKIQRDRKFAYDENVISYRINLDDIFEKESSFNIYLDNISLRLISKIRENTVPLQKIAYCTVGINTGYIKDELTSKTQIDETYHKMLNGKDIGINSLEWKGEWIRYDHEYVKSFGAKGRSLPPEKIFKNDKILVQRTRRGMKRKLVCYFDEKQFYNLNRLSNIIIEDNDYDLKYVHGLMNSRLFDYYFNKVFNEYEVKPLHLNQLPIKLKSSNYDEIIEKVNEIINLKHKDPEFDTLTLEVEIDNLVYQLYGLTDEEIAIVEEGTK